MNGLIYDCEIIRCIPSREIEPELEYCKGWDDFDGMGLSVIGVWDLKEDIPRVFLGDNSEEFQTLVKDREHIIGFNSLAFDDNLCAANGIAVTTTYDLLCEVRAASGQPRHYTPDLTRGGYSLDALARTNLEISKSGSGSLAPKLWQQGEYGAVIDYCLRDVMLTKRLFEKRDRLTDPVDGSPLCLREPDEPILEGVKFLDFA
jgi:DEAD/DEAH box helicase domain-containing protein